MPLQYDRAINCLLSQWCICYNKSTHFLLFTGVIWKYRVKNQLRKYNATDNTMQINYTD